MNRLLLIGNGFDLAHGMKTSYYDFFIDFLRESLNSSINKGIDVDKELFKINLNYSTVFQRDIDTDDKLINFYKNDRRIINKSSFFIKLLDSYQIDKWVDVETLYFEFIVEMFQNKSTRNENIQKLNRDFSFLTNEIQRYLIKEEERLDHQSIKESHFNKFDRFDKSLFDKYYYDKTIALNFNYTNTLQRFGYDPTNEFLFIHGNIDETQKSPIIFGYANYEHEEYQKIDDSAVNFYLDFFKPNYYNKNDKYLKLLNFLNEKPFMVSIVGHSCGISDKFLLKEIFRHGNCDKIEIFYHLDKNGNDNWKDINQNINRCFSNDLKNKFLQKLSTQNEDKIIPQFFD